jgi:NAD(P)-dependent dehydrogenase (short-subunit alcohol dehydrogenase family)
MELAGKVVVVTGGAGGIGSALAERAFEEGAKGVVAADLTAPDLPGILGVACDATSEDDTRALLERAESELGPVDVFFANAGVAIGEDEQTDWATWDTAFAVNIHAHVIAARLLVPGWLERGSGCFVATASAAGLLTQIGSAPYAVTKHAAVAFAEWLSVTYGDRGIHVSCICPMGVDTAMLAGTQDTSAGAAVTTAGAVLPPEAVADAVVAALAEERFLVLPHPEVLEFFRRKASDYDRWLAGMRRLRHAAEGA